MTAPSEIKCTALDGESQLLLESRRRKGRRRRDQSKPCYLFCRWRFSRGLLLASIGFVLLFRLEMSQSALLTNIYGKKLSEITDLAHTFLLLPNHHHHNSSSPFSSSSSSSQSSSDPVVLEGLGRQDKNKSEGRPDSLASQSASTIEQLPVPQARIATSWQQQFVAGTGPQYQRLPGGRQSTTNGSSVSTSDSVSNRQIAGEPMVLESVSTELPNPNINNKGHEITKILRKFFQHGYDKRVRPNYSGPPALVNVSFHIIGISSVDEVQMDFTTDFYFRQKWFDPRLVFEPVEAIDELCVGAEFAEKIWLPDTFFANEKTATFHKATTENTFIRIGNSGRVYRSIRLTVTCSCPMDLQYFPMDRQRCKIEIESYGYNTRDIDYRWERGDASVTLNTKIELPQFKILGFKMGQELQNLSSGDYIRLYCEIHFVRSMGYYLIQIYIPASLIVMISWVSFWLHRNATPARVALGVTTVLTMTTLMSSTNAALPKISYIKSIDVFLGTCFVMVFASLLEYASVGYIGKRIAMKRKRLQDLQQMQQHHQKVCVAAAASAAAAVASAANNQQQQHDINKFASPSLAANHQFQVNRPTVGGGLANKINGDLMADEYSGSQTLQRRATTSMAMRLTASEGSKTLQMRHRASVGGHYSDLDSPVTAVAETAANPPNNQQRSSIKVLLDNSRNSQQVAGHYHQRPLAANANSAKKVNMQDQQSSRTPLLAAVAGIPLAAAGQQAVLLPSVQQGTATSEFEVSQTHDMIRICGLTPSAIDKHSRVVFPICFVCFNLMYWIIYGHISQQIEDKGPPLIPFIKG